MTPSTQTEKILQDMDEFENPKMTEQNRKYFEKKYGKEAEKEFLKQCKKHPLESYAKYNQLKAQAQTLLEIYKEEVKWLESCKNDILFLKIKGDKIVPERISTLKSCINKLEEATE